jgi:hypothetical protein
MMNTIAMITRYCLIQNVFLDIWYAKKSFSLP